MQQDHKAQQMTASFEEITFSNMLIVQALVELLAEKCVISNQEVLGRVQRLRRETKVNKADVPEREASVVRVTIEDLIASNTFAVEALLAILVDKAFLTEAGMRDLLVDLRDKARKAVSRKQ
jgi:hypothetical protein